MSSIKEQIYKVEHQANFLPCDKRNLTFHALTKIIARFYKVKLVVGQSIFNSDGVYIVTGQSQSPFVNSIFVYYSFGDSKCIASKKRLGELQTHMGHSFFSPLFLSVKQNLPLRKKKKDQSPGDLLHPPSDITRLFFPQYKTGNFSKPSLKSVKKVKLKVSTNFKTLWKIISTGRGGTKLTSNTWVPR